MTDRHPNFIQSYFHGTKANLGDPRPRLMKLLTNWTRERFAP